MTYVIKYLKLAQDDVKEIREYLSQFYQGTAPSFMSDLRTHVNRLKETPLMCEQYRDDAYYRKMVIRDYLVFYHVDDERHAVEIHRILNGSRNVKRYL